MEAQRLADHKVLEIAVNVKRKIREQLEHEVLSFLKKYVESLFAAAVNEQIGADRYEPHPTAYRLPQRQVHTFFDHQIWAPR